MTEYKITPEKQWSCSWQILSFFLFSFVGAVLTHYMSPEDTLISILLWYGGFFMVQLLFQGALHLNYFIVNKNDVFTYDSATREMSFQHNNSVLNFSSGDIEKVVLHTSPPLHKKNMHFFAWDSYSHAVILLISGERLVVTCLMVGQEVDLLVPPDKLKVKMNVYRWAFGPSLSSFQVRQEKIGRPIADFA